MGNWDNLSLTEKAAMIRVAVKNGITNLQDIKREYNEFAEGGDTNPRMTGMMKSKLATAAHFGNPTARRMTNYDARSYIWPGEYEYDNGIGELKRGNVFVGSYDNLVTPQIQDDGKGLIFVDDVWSPENDQRSYMQSLKFSNEKDARYFGEHYKEIAPMMNLYSNGGYKPSERIKQRITHYEGKAMTGAKDPVSGKWGKNNSFESEAKRFYSVLPETIREKVLSNPELADSLYSYSYNVGAGNFKKRVVPALEKYYAGEGSVKDIENSMWASNDSKLRGLQRRRAEERAGVRSALLEETTQLFPKEQELPIFVPNNPEVFFATPDTYQLPIVVEESEVQEPVAISPYSPEEIDRQERMNKLSAFNKILSLTNPYPQEENSFLSTIGLLTGNTFSKGGGIHIKPENRGKFTALKKRTGHSASWFKAHGTPAQKKMATFALNARKWNHK